MTGDEQQTGGLPRRSALVRSAAGTPYAPAQNPYINDPPIQPGIPDDQFDGPIDNPLTRTAPPSTTRPRQQPSGAPADYSVTPGSPSEPETAPAPPQTALGGRTMFPIVCRADGTRIQVRALSEDMTCPACKVGTHLDLDDDLGATAQMYPDDPMDLLPGGTPEQDQDMGLVDPDAQFTVPVPEGSAPYSEDALEEPINAAARKVALRPHDRVWVYGQPGFVGTVVGDKPADYFVTDRDRVVVRNDRTGQEKALSPTIIIPLDEAKRAWHVFDASGNLIAGGPTISESRAREIAEERGGTAQQGLGKFASRRTAMHAYQMARIGSLVREQNPDLPLEQVRRIAERTIERFPSVTGRQFYDLDGNPSDEFVPGGPLDYSTEGTTPVRAGDLKPGDVVRSWSGMAPTTTVQSVEPGSHFGDHLNITYTDGSRETMVPKGRVLHLESTASRKTAVTYGEGARYSGNTLEQAIETAKDAAQRQKTLVIESAWEDYVVLDKGDQGVYGAYKASAWTPQSGSMLPYSAPPPGTIVARVSPDGQVRRVSEKVGSRRTAAEDWGAILTQAVTAGEAAWQSGNPGNVFRPGFVNVTIPGNGPLARYIRANNVPGWRKGYPSGLSYFVRAPQGIDSALIQDGNRNFAYAQAFAGVLNQHGVGATVSAIDD